MYIRVVISVVGSSNY